MWDTYAQLKVFHAQAKASSAQEGFSHSSGRCLPLKRRFFSPDGAYSTQAGASSAHDENCQSQAVDGYAQVGASSTRAEALST